jgi:hypothetical protein
MSFHEVEHPFPSEFASVVRGVKCSSGIRVILMEERK